MTMKSVVVISVLLVVSAHGFGISRRALIVGGVSGVPSIAFASGAGPEEAAKYAEKYRVKPVCTPTTPQFCNENYAKSLDPRRGLTPEQLAARDKRNEAELASLRSQLVLPKT